jgi:prepilin-type N-terminal cleavage/methylation domain-containing protein
MKLAPSLSSHRRVRLRSGGFSLPELMVAMTVFVLLLGGVIFANLYGLSMFKLTETKLNATDDARKPLWFKHV